MKEIIDNQKREINSLASVSTMAGGRENSSLDFQIQHLLSKAPPSVEPGLDPSIVTDMKKKLTKRIAEGERKL